jgi:hypothetical protein
MVNFTLVIQVIHFWVAYFILSRLLFKPAYDLIVADEQQARALEKQINRVETTIAEQTTNNKHEWVRLQQDLQKQVPPTQYAMVKAAAREPAPQPRVVSEQEVQALVVQTRDMIMNRVSNGICD